MTKAQPKKAAPAKAEQTGSGQAPAATKTLLVPALKIVSERDSFRRAGMAFGKHPSIIKRSHLSAAQIEQLKAEPLLTVAEIEIEDKTTAE